jgi:uncharacterized protein
MAELVWTAVLGGLTPTAFAATVMVTLFAAFVKGAIGFAMPLIMISAFAAFMPPPLAVAALVLSVVVTNGLQAFRQGRDAVWGTVVKYRRMIGMIVLFIVVSAQFLLVIPTWLLLGLLGLPVTVFALSQLLGRPWRLRLRHQRGAEYGLGIVGGLYGGISGVWGPPVIVYLVSINAEKREALRVQGVIFLIGSVVLLSAHLHSGVLNATTLPLSAALVVPALLGMWLGFRLQDRLDQTRFRHWTLILLVLTGLNLIRQALAPFL